MAIEEKAAFANFAVMHRAEGLRPALAQQLKLTDYRFIGIWRFENGKANAVVHYDRENPEVLAATEVPDTATYCCYVRESGQPFMTPNALVDARLGSHPAREQVFFEGTAREAAAAYPKNANVSVAVGLAGIGLDRTRVRLVSSRAVADPLGVIEAAGAFGRFRFEILALASPSNPKTSALTGYSLLQCARLGGAWPVTQMAAFSI